MPLYGVEVKIKFIVQADDPDHAYDIGEQSSLIREVVGDLPHNEIRPWVSNELDTLEKVKAFGQGWDGECLPYGDSDGNTRIKDLLDSKAT